MCDSWSLTSQPDSSTAIPVQWDVLGSAQIRACAPGLLTLRASARIAATQAIHCFVPPLSLSHFTFINAIPLGGSQTSASMLHEGIVLKTSRESPHTTL